MRIIGSDKHKMVIKENSYELLAKSILFFMIGLIITINAAHNRETIMLLTMLIGPILMASSFLFFVLSYRTTTIVIDRYGKKILRGLKKISKKYTEKITIDDIEEIGLSSEQDVKRGIINKSKTNIYIIFNDNSILKINNKGLKDKKAVNIAYEISSFLNIPMKRI